MGHTVIDSTAVAAESSQPASPIRAMAWAAGIGISGVLVLVVLLGADLLFDSSPGAREPAARQRVTLSAPREIGDLRSRDSDFPDRADQAGQATAAQLSEPFTVTYADQVSPALVATVWGGRGRLGGSTETLEDFRDATVAMIPGATPGVPQGADPSPTAGLAQCTPVENLDVHATICVWTLGDAVLAILAIGYDMPAATALLPDLLTALVKVR